MAHASRLPAPYKAARDALKTGTTVAAATAAAGANPTKAEYDALVASFNSLRSALVGLGIVS